MKSLWKEAFDPVDEEDLPEGYPVLNFFARNFGMGGAILIWVLGSGLVLGAAIFVFFSL